MESESRANGGDVTARKQAFASTLCEILSVDLNIIPPKIIVGSDTVYSLVKNIVELPSMQETNQEIKKWFEYGTTFPPVLDSSNDKLRSLNDELSQKSVLGCTGFKLSPADIILFVFIHPFALNFTESDMQKLPHLMRWMDYIQNCVDFCGFLETIPIKKPQFYPPQSKKIEKTETNTVPRKVLAEPKTVKPEASAGPKKLATEKKTVAADEKAKVEPAKTKNNKNNNDKKTEDKKKSTEESTEKDSSSEFSVSLLNIQVGLIRKAWKHPSADSLLVEEIDVGEGNVRHVVSGLAKYCSPEDLSNRRVVLITNVKPGKLRDVMSSGLVLCASNEDHTVLEPLIAPEGCKIGERVTFSGYEGKPEDVLNPKKKQLEKITPHLYTDEKGIATFKGVPFMTSAGPCTSSLPKASIK